MNGMGARRIVEARLTRGYGRNAGAGWRMNGSSVLEWPHETF